MHNFFHDLRSKKISVAVIGDAMVDVYHYGKVNRVSPEFPVPILQSPDFKPQFYPGGALNVCYQFKDMNARASLFSFLDWESRKQLSKIKFNLKGCIYLDGGCIPRKIRFYDEDFPLLRYDIEQVDYGLQNLVPDRESLCEKFQEALENGGFDVVILSNYEKGVFSESLAKKIIDLCNKNNVLTLVDPKKHPERWKGCTVFKPNAKEALVMTGEKEWQRQCDRLMEIVGCETVIITHAGDGVFGKTGDHYFSYQPTIKNKEVSSVIGAGDCFIAVLAVCLAWKVPIQEAIKYSFYGGSLYVKEKHNRPITIYELHRCLDPIQAKIMTADEVSEYRHDVYSDCKWVLTNGCFDLLTPGHIQILKYAKSKGDKLVVAVNSDESIRNLKGNERPIVPLQQRMEVLAGIEFVDFIVPFEESTPYDVIKKIIPHELVKGSDYNKEEVAGADIVGDDHVHLVPMVQGCSTTKIVEKIKML